MSDDPIERAAGILRAGGLVAFPTETVYGLGADAANANALRRLYAVKGRPADHPVIVHVGHIEQLDDLAVDVPDAARALAAEFWPGPLTLVLRKRAGVVAEEATGGRATVGVRVPDHPVALALLDRFGGGVAAPSANRFGKVSPTTAQHVHHDLGTDVDAVIDGGASAVGVESTIVDVTGSAPTVLRVGGVSEARLARVLGTTLARRTQGEVAAPGTLRSHYAPDARVELVAAEDLETRLTALRAAGTRAGALETPADPADYARVLYARLREADAAQLEVVLAVAPADDGGIGAAVLDRLNRRPAANFAVMTHDERPIGVFDSGLGGLTVVRALLDLLPGERVVYFGDTGRFPYGPKPSDEVLKYSFEIVDVLLQRNVKMVVVACNSASAAALDHLRDQLDIPVVGVIEPGLRAARRATRSGRVGVIGTVGTIGSGAYQRAATALGADFELTCAACPGFVEFVEQGDVESDQVHVLAERLLAPVRRADVDTLVLGCTHYPLLARTIGDVMGPEVVLVSSADETAFEVRNELGQDLAPARGPAHAEFVTSGDVATFRSLGARFLGPEVEQVEAWSWS